MKTKNHREIAAFRSQIIGILRNFFISREYLEVDTPILAPFRIPESHIEVFSTRYYSPNRSPKNMCLIPSPELWMKRLLAEDFPSCFQITKSFRNNEQLGAYHNPEFTMLEWYTTGACYNQSLKHTEELFAHFCTCGFEIEGWKGNRDSITLSVAEVFHTLTGIDIEQCDELSTLQKHARSVGYPAEGASWEEVFNKLFLLYIEPKLQEFPVLFLTDYPRQIPCLAKQKGRTSFRERWELYIHGIELANCFTEENKRKEVRDFINGEAATSKRGQSDSDETRIDTNFDDISGNLPLCSGVALGVDRLIMLLTGARSISEVLLFPFEEFI